MSEIDPILEIYDKQASNYDIMNSFMERIFSKERNIFSLLRGEILEVGVGTGENLKYYHPSANITAFDWSPQMIRHAAKKVRYLGFQNIKEFIVGDIQKLDEYFLPNSFDFVTSTCVFCSVPNPIKGLQKVARVMKKSGRLVQIEHGISNFKLLNILMKGFDPITSNMRGFHLTRNIKDNLEKAGFKIIREWSIDAAGIIRVVISKLKLSKI
ncbi:MAG: class I SAM-dependent methyltransferase [Candidatus Odinarchaeota archaeon]